MTIIRRWQCLKIIASIELYLVHDAVALNKIETQNAIFGIVI